jgi:hypothetical protein
MLATLRTMCAALDAAQDRAALVALYSDWLAVDPEPEYTLDDLRDDLTDHLRECCHAGGIHWQTLTR